jgi:hypothetical protein
MSDKPYTATSLEDIAQVFDTCAATADLCEARAHTVRHKAEHRAEARTYREAARILRQTTIEEDKS